MGSMTASDARCTSKIEFKFAMSKAALNKERNFLTSDLDLNKGKKLAKCYIWSVT